MLLLEKLLDGLDINVKPFALCHAAPGSSLPMTQADEAMIHYVLSGKGQIDLKGHPSIDLSEGTMVILPKGAPHELVGLGEQVRGLSELSRCRPLAGGFQIVSPSENGKGIIMACGLISATYQGTQGIFDYLPAPIVERATPGDSIRRAFENLLQELAAPQSGTEAMTRALMQQLLVTILRRYCESGMCQVPWLSALEHPRLSEVLGKILKNPGRSYTVEILSEIAGMSRSAFSDHFVKTFGRSPMDFVKEVRLRRAAQLLKTSRRPIKSIAADVGYDSRSHFSAAFKGFFGLTPAEYRETEETGIH